MKKFLSIIMIALTVSAFVSCDKKSNKASSKLNDSISEQAGAFVGAQIAGSIMGDSVNGSKVDLDAFYEGFVSVFSRDTTDVDMSYLGGIQMAFRTYQMLAQMGVDIESLDRDLFLNAFRNSLKSKDTALMNPIKMQNSENVLMELINRASEIKMVENKKAGAKYMATRAKEKGFIKTQSGIMYRVLKEGSGENFTADDVINVLYEGKHVNGETFDKTVDQPRPMSVKGVIPGFGEMLQLMKPGMKVEVIIPGDLAYGPQGNQNIEPGETLVFTLETVGKAEQPQGMPQGQPQIIPVE